MNWKLFIKHYFDSNKLMLCIIYIDTFNSLEIKLVEVNLEHKHPNAVHLKSDLKVLANSTNIESRNRNLSGSDKYSLSKALFN